VLLPYGKAEFQYLAQSNAQNVTAQLVGAGSPTIVPKLGQDKTFGTFAAGASAIFPQGFSGFFNYEQLFGKDNYKDQRYTLGLRVEF
jgi:outer membrane autotransporter protein